MKKLLTFIIIGIISSHLFFISNCIKNDNLSDITLDDIEALADEEIVTACHSKLLSATKETNEYGATLVINNYECGGSRAGSCGVGLVILYYDSKGNFMGIDDQRTTLYCI